MWAKEVLDYCCHIAEKHNRAFYVFQSAPKETPKVLLLGLNPGEDYYYETKMTLKVFTEQNQWYFGGKNHNPKTKWNILKKLEKTIEVNEKLNNEFSNMVYMNLLFFTSSCFSVYNSTFGSSF